MELKQQCVGGVKSAKNNENGPNSVFFLEERFSSLTLMNIFFTEGLFTVHKRSVLDEMSWR